jgi:hypothetical protein
MKTKKRDRIVRANKRRVWRETRTNAEQIAHLDQLLGVGVGAVKERARLTSPVKKPSKGTK